MVGVDVEWMWAQYKRRQGQIPVAEMVAVWRQTYRTAVDAGVLLDIIPSLQ